MEQQSLPPGAGGAFALYPHMETNGMKQFWKWTALALVLLQLTGCSLTTELSDQNDPRIFGATYMTRNNPYFDVLHNAIESVVESNGDILIVRDPCQDQQKQNEQILEMIDEGISVLFLNPADWIEVTPALEACREAGVVVINVDTVVQDTEYVVSVVETDNYQAGVLCAQEMMTQITEGDILILGNPVQMSIVNRIQGFLDTIGDNPGFRVRYVETSAGEFELSADAVNEIIDQEGGEFRYEVILGGNDPSALGALAALQQNRLEDQGVLIYGIDGSPDFKAMLELGYVSGTSTQSPGTIGRVAAETAYAYLDGQTVEPYISIEPHLITEDNLEYYEINEWE